MRGGNGIRIGRVAGIPIILDLGFFLFFALITAILGANIFPDIIEPDPSAGVAWGLAILTAIIFFITLLMHELAHSLMARLYGMKVANITLLMFGGVSHITEESKRASQEFLIAVVGPLTSAGLGGLFIGAYSLVGAGNCELPAVLLYLGFINLALAVFNMVPGFPLDGGRVLRAAIWLVTGSQRRATRWAARVGQAVAGALILFAVVSIAGIGIQLGGLSAIWLIFIGAILYNAASQALRVSIAEERLANVSVRDVMSTQLRRVERDTQVRWIVPVKEQLDPGMTFLVTDNETVIGLVPAAKILLLDEPRYATATMVDVMISADAVQPIAPSATGQEALDRLEHGDSPVIPVVEDGRLLGLIGLEQMAGAVRGPGDAPAAG